MTLTHPFGFLSAVDTPASLGADHWYRSDLGVTKDGGNRVSVWADQIGTFDFNQGTGTFQPLWRASQINGQPDLYFDGSRFMAAGTSNPAPAFHVILVLRQISWTAGRVPWSGGNSGGSLEIRQAGVSPQLLQYAGATNANAVNLTVGTWFLLNSLFNGLSSSQTRNNDAPVSGGVNPGTNNHGTARLGSNQNGANNADITVAEVITYDNAMSAGQIAGIQSYINRRYGLW